MPQVKIILSIVGILLLSGIAVSLGRSQVNSAMAAQGENPQVMQSLLSEVRQLRIAIQRANLNTYLTQTALERMRMQQQRVDRQAEQLGGLRKHAANMKMEQAEMQEELKRIEQRLAQEPDAGKRSEMEQHQGAVKLRIDLVGKEIDRVREQEGQLAAQLQVEQNRLSELNDQLDAVQRELQNSIEESKTTPGAKQP